MSLINTLELLIQLAILGALLIFLIWYFIYECIVLNNIRKACNIYINKNKFYKQPEEVIYHESTTNEWINW